MAAGSASSIYQLSYVNWSRLMGAVYGRSDRLPEHALTLFPPSAGALRGVMRSLGQTVATARDAPR